MSGLPLRVGYLHLGAATHGIARYSRLLAAEARRAGTVGVIERAVELTSGWRANHAALAEAGRYLAGGDLVHIQYSHLQERSIWGSGWRRVSYLAAFLLRARRPVIVTAHDVYHPAPGRLRRGLVSDRIALRQLARAADVWLVSSAEERRRLLEWVPRANVEVVPLFVEECDVPADGAAAKRELGLSGTRVVTLLGFIHRRKGYRLLLEALPHLPQDVHVVLAGEPIGDAGAAREVDALAGAHRHRVRITGYLAEPQLKQYLAATDLAVCPFSHMSASASLSTWIAAGRPILASDLPQIAEYNRIIPGAIETFTPYTPAALSASICKSLQAEFAARRSAVARLGAALRLPSVFERHVDLYAMCSGLRGACVV